MIGLGHTLVNRTININFVCIIYAMSLYTSLGILNLFPDMNFGLNSWKPGCVDWIISMLVMSFCMTAWFMDIGAVM